jgi:hypothetical protein
MGVRDLPFWARVAGLLADMGMDSLGAKRCAVKGHKWRDVEMVVLRKDGGVEQHARGAAQRCARCGEERQKVSA